MIILEGRYSYQEILEMPISEIEEHLACNEKYVEMKNKVMEEEKVRQRKEQARNKYKKR